MCRTRCRPMRATARRACSRSGPGRSPTSLVPAGPRAEGKPPQATGPPTSVALFDQGLLQVLQASATGPRAAQPYVLALADKPDGSGTLQPLAKLHDQPGGLRHRECHRADPPDRRASAKRTRTTGAATSSSRRASTASRAPVQFRRRSARAAGRGRPRAYRTKVPEPVVVVVYLERHAIRRKARLEIVLGLGVLVVQHGT